MLALGDSQGGKELQDSAAIILHDVHLADGRYKETTAEGFELALRVLYPEYVEINLWRGRCVKRTESFFLQDDVCTASYNSG